jgi:hypothetical protein
MEEKMDDNTMIEDERHMIIKREVWNQQILQELFGKLSSPKEYAINCSAVTN